MNIERRKVRVALLSVVSNTSLVLMKLGVGLLIGSVSILSEAIHSVSDLVAALIALFSVKKSGQPADSRHPFGHGKVENISGTLEAMLIFLAAAWIVFEAIRRLLHPEPLETVGLGVAIMLISSGANIAVSRRLFKVGKETDSIALQADAWHLRTDVYTSAGVMISLALIWIGRRVFPGVNLDWLDPAAAIGVALLILKAAYELTLQSARDLMDVSLPEDEKAWIMKLIEDYRSVIHGCHEMRTRKAGHFRYVEFHLKVDPEMSVGVSHAVTVVLKQKIKARFPDTSVLIHIEPCDGNCDGRCLDGCLLPEKERGNPKGIR
jgi:cation diffusion facilitator family transporter